ncbi:MAG: NB-ARC domain-containing protein [Cyanobacteria bacterium P01_A01_bin.114]
MPRLNTSKQVKLRTRRLLEKLLSYANYELAESDYFEDKLMVRWKNEATTAPELIVETELKVLMELAFSRQEDPKLKEQLRNDLRVLEEFLNILEDNRARTQGSKDWRFTLKLWGKSTEANLEAFESIWDQRKGRRKPKSYIQDRISPPKPIIPDADVLQPSVSPAPTVVPSAAPADSPSDDSGLIAEAVQTNLLIPPGSTYQEDESHLAELLQHLSFQHSDHLITLEGVGGVGKTTLALEAANRCLAASQYPSQHPHLPHFKAIIFTSAQTHHFSGPQLYPRLGQQRNLQDIFRTIVRTLGRPSELPIDFNDQLATIRDSLGQQPTLLIVDNLETLEDRDYVLSFLREIPPTVKVIITSRVRLGMGVALPIKPLPAKAGIAFLKAQAQAQALNLSEAQLKHLHKQTGGLPLAMVYCLGMIATYGISPDDLDYTQLASGDVARHCFDTSIERLRGQNAHALLMAFACFQHPALPEAVAHVAFASDYLRCDRTPFNELYRLSLIDLQQSRYTMHSLTREYARTELVKTPAFEREARNRWLEWYLEFLAVHGETDWYDWHPASPVETEWANLREVVEWCRAEERYEEFIEFWDYLKGYTQIYGHWNERLTWMEWLIAEAEKRIDWEIMADAMYHHARTLGFFNQPEKSKEAIILGQRIWEIADLDNKRLLVDVATLLSKLYVQLEQIDHAFSWIERAQTLLKNSIKQEERYVYQMVDVPYCQAEAHLKAKNFDQAEQIFQHALEKAEAIGWRRAQAYIKGWIAAIAIEQNELDKARNLFETILPVAKQHNDQRCLAICYGYLTQLEQQQGNPEASQKWAILARNSSEMLNMKLKASQQY